MRRDEIAAIRKAAEEAEKKFKISESGKSVYVEDKKYTDTTTQTRTLKNRIRLYQLF